MSSSDLTETLRDATQALAAELDRNTAAGVPLREMQGLFAALVRAYAARREEGDRILPFAAGHGVTATEVAVTATGMLEAADMAVFELGMWQTIKGGTGGRA